MAPAYDFTKPDDRSIILEVLNAVVDLSEYALLFICLLVLYRLLAKQKKSQAREIFSWSELPAKSVKKSSNINNTSDVTWGQQALQIWTNFFWRDCQETSRTFSWIFQPAVWKFLEYQYHNK